MYGVGFKLLHVYKNVGMWRSLVAHYAGGVGVVGSNPAVPTIHIQAIKSLRLIHLKFLILT